MNRPRMRLLVAAVAALTLTAPPAPVGATGPPWPAVDCASGAMTATVTPDRTITVSGWIQPCPSSSFGSEMRFTVTYYGAWSVRSGSLLEYTAGAAGPTPFTRSVAAAALDDPVRAVCLDSQPGEAGRVACVQIDVSGSGLPLVTPITVDDVLLRAPRAPADPLSDQFCGTCV